MKTFILPVALVAIVSCMAHAQPIDRDVPIYPTNPPAPHLLDFDKQVIATLKTVHNSGADLYNGNDYSACYYMYLGSLTTLEPLLKHHPKIQQTMAQGRRKITGMAVDGIKVQAFKMHEVIETVRNELQAEVKQMEKPAPGKLNPVPEKNKEKSKEEQEKLKETEKKKAEAMKAIEEAEAAIIAAKDKAKRMAEEAAKKAKEEAEALKMKAEEAAKEAQKEKKAANKNPGGTVMLEGKPVSKAEVAMTSLNLDEPRVFTATTDDAGKFTLPKDVVDGKYRVTISGDNVPSQYAMTNTSPLTITIKDGTGNYDWKLEK